MVVTCKFAALTRGAIDDSRRLCRRAPTRVAGTPARRRSGGTDEVHIRSDGCRDRTYAVSLQVDNCGARRATSDLFGGGLAYILGNGKGAKQALFITEMT